MENNTFELFPAELNLTVTPRTYRDVDREKIAHLPVGLQASILQAFAMTGVIPDVYAKDVLLSWTVSASFKVSTGQSGVIAYALEPGRPAFVADGWPEGMRAYLDGCTYLDAGVWELTFGFGGTFEGTLPGGLSAAIEGLSTAVRNHDPITLKLAA
jgi:hypothetical protein